MRYMKTEYDGYEFITAGKIYQVSRVDEFGDNYIIDDEGDEIFPLHPQHGKCAYLEGKGTWIICDKEGNPL